MFHVKHFCGEDTFRGRARGRLRKGQNGPQGRSGKAGAGGQSRQTRPEDGLPWGRILRFVQTGGGYSWAGCLTPRMVREMRPRFWSTSSTFYPDDIPDLEHIAGVLYIFFHRSG